MFEGFYMVFMVCYKIFALYFIGISVFALMNKKEVKKVQKQLKFGVIIAARNEESCIKGIIESLQKQSYPSELIDIIVVANNCTDRTAVVAKNAGALVLTAPDFVKSKGAALNFSMQELLTSKEKYDAFLVFDADNEASTQFVSAMNQTLCNGARVAKSKILAKNPRDSWVTACYDIHFCTSNLFLNKARTRLGLSARLIGTGFAIRCDYLRELGGFHTKTITEDAEFFAICACKGEKIAFCEEAITYDEEPIDFTTSLVQRKRWVSGILQVTRLKLFDLIKGLGTSKSTLFSFDALMQFIFIYLQAIMPFVLLLSIIFAPNDFSISFLPSMLVAYLAVVANSIFVLLLEKRMCCSKNLILGIVMSPIFALSFIALQTLSLFQKTVKWKEIKHTGVRMEQIENSQLSYVYREKSAS